MKLLYLYVETWPARCITTNNPIEVNFDCGYKFHYDSETNRLSCEVGEELPEGFFSVSSSLACVDAVSVIIGDNGTGKTTIASVLGYLFQRGKHLPEYICIYKQAGRLVLYYHFEDGRGTPDHSSIVGEWVDAETDAEYSDVLRHDYPFDIIYYSPYFSTNEVWPGNVLDGVLGDENNSLCDLSTGGLVQHAKTIGRNMNQIKAFQSEDIERVLRFAHKYVNDFGGKKGSSLARIDGIGPILPLPRYAQFLVDATLLIPVARAEVIIAADVNSGDLEDLICNVGSNNPIWKIASAVLLYMSRLPSKKVGNQDVTMLNNVLREVCLVSKKISSQTSCVGMGKRFAEEVSRIRVDGGSAVARSLMKVLRPMARIYGKTVDSKRGGKYVLGNQVDITDKRDLDDVIDVNRHWPEFESRFGQLIGSSVSLMNVSIANMSSGEMAYWTLFARIYDALEPQKEKKVGRDILLFLDEAETTLHPEWQRQLVRNVIWFLEKYTKDRHVHVIFATHSPMIISDVPKGNVAFLLKARKDSDGHEQQGLPDMQETLKMMTDTFGANIFDLYRHPFFMQEGTVAAFAAKKLDDLVKKVYAILAGKKGYMISQKEWCVAEMVGDPQVRKYFESIKPLLGHALKKKG